MQSTCQPTCALAYAREQQAKRAARSWSERRAALKTRGDYLREAQDAFNTFIRARDLGLPCISCGAPHMRWNQAGHFLGVGAFPELRFCEDNCNGQCVRCNKYLGGNAGQYRLRLIQKIGIDRVLALEVQHPPLKLDICALIQIKKMYRLKLLDLRKSRALSGAESSAMLVP
jgi:hypothetical protein